MTSARTVLYFSDLAILGGGEMCLLALADQLDRARFRPVVLAPEDGPLLATTRERGMRGYAVKLHGGMRFWRIRRYSPLLHRRREHNIVRIASLFRDEGVELVHTHGGMWPENIAYLGRVARAAGVPLLWECAYGAVYPHEVMRTMIAPWVDQVIAVSNAVSASLRQAGWPDPARVEVLHNGIDLHRWQPGSASADALAARDKLRRELGAGSGDVLFGMVGRVIPIKGHDVFLDAARRVIPCSPRARFVVVGDQRPLDGRRATYFRDLQSEAKGPDLAERVVMAGWREDAHAVMDALDVLVQPSRNDAFPLTVIEAMALAKPVVATRVGGMPEAVADGETGFVVPVDDADALAERLLALAADDELQGILGRKGRERALTRFDLRARSERVQAIYDRLLSSEARLTSRSEGARNTVEGSVPVAG